MTVADEASPIPVHPGRSVDYTGRAIGPLRLGRAMIVNVVAGTCIMAAIAVLWPTAAITAIFLREQLGASKTLIGLNLTLSTFGTAVALPGAWLFARLQRRRETWMAVTAATRAFMFAPALAALVAGNSEWSSALVWVVILSLFVVNTGSVFTSPGWWSWMADLIPESILGSFFGRRYRWLLLGQSVAALVAGLLLDRAGGPASLRLAFFGIFALAAALAVIDPLLFLLVPEPVRPPPPRQTLRQVAREYLEPFRDAAFRKILIAAGAYGFFYFLPNIFLPLFLRGEEVGGMWIGGRAPLWLLSLTTVFFACATAVSAGHWGRLADRIGHRTVWILGSLAYFTHAAYYFLNAHNYAWLSLAQYGLFGLLYAGQQVAVQNLALSTAPAARREYYMSIFQAVTQVATGFAPVLGGWLADHTRVLSVMLPSGQPACYIHLLLAVSFAGMLLILPVMVAVPDPKGVAVLPWFGRLISGDLLRTAWNIGVLGSALSSSRRLRALRRISERDGNVMLPDIMNALDDSDLAIRREALLALGRLGTPEALDLLRWYLHEPDAMLRAPSVEAIAQTRVPDRVSLLTRALRDPDSRVRRAAAAALGRSGDRNGVEELRRLLTAEPDGEVLVSAAVALSNLREFSAVREMMHLALHSTNTTVRSQMLVAIADLLGGSGDFHTLWRRDRQWRGSAFARLARRLRRQVRAAVRHARSSEGGGRPDRSELAFFEERIEAMLECAQAERWRDTLAELRRLATHCLRLRYAYRGDEERALEFVSAVAPDQAQRYWLISYLYHACDGRVATEAPWDGLALLGLYVLVHGQGPE